MGMETAEIIGQLRKDWPLKDDLIPEADDHLREIKKAIKQTFPGPGIESPFTRGGGDGFTKVITATEDEINHLAGVTTDVQTQIDTEVTTRGDADAALDARVIALEAVSHAMSALFPVGSIYFMADGVSPATRLGFGVWARLGEGRFLVSQGTDVVNGVSRGYVRGADAWGEYRHQLTIDEMPAHTHPVLLGDSDNSGSVIEHGSDRGTSTDNTQSTGGDAQHENSPPAFGIYMWERTA